MISLLGLLCGCNDSGQSSADRKVGPPARIAYADGSPVDAKLARAIVVTVLSELPPLGEKRRPLAAVRFEPDGAQFPAGLRVTWPLVEHREPGEMLAVVFLDESSRIWADSGERAVVDATGQAAEGRVFHFCVGGVATIDDLLGEGVPVVPQRATSVASAGIEIPTGSVAATPSGAVAGAKSSNDSAVSSVPQDNLYGVAFVAWTNGRGDSVEQHLFENAGTIPEVDHIFSMESAADLFGKLARIKNRGRKIDCMVLAAHGSKETPGLTMAKEDIIAEEVDIAWRRQQISIAEDYIRLRKFDDKKPEGYFRGVIAEHQKAIAVMEAVSGVMAKDGRVIMINCSAAATDRGKRYVRNLGRILLGENGGVIAASRKDIAIKVIPSVLAGAWHQLFYGQWVGEGDLVVDGDWVRFRVKPLRKGIVEYRGLASSNRLWTPGEIMDTVNETNTNIESSAEVTIDVAAGTMTGVIRYANKYEPKGVPNAKPTITNEVCELSGKPVLSWANLPASARGELAVRGTYERTSKYSFDAKPTRRRGPFVALLFRGPDIGIPAYPDYTKHFLVIFNVENRDASLVEHILANRAPSPLDPPKFKPLHQFVLAVLHPADETTAQTSEE